MRTLEERILKALLKEREVIDRKIEKISNKILLTKIIVLWCDLTNKKEVLKALKKVLYENQHPWFHLILLSPNPFSSNISIFGRRNIIACNLRKIAKKAAAGKGLKRRGICVGFDLLMQKLEYMI